MRYLLGDISEDEKTRMEEAYFADNAKFDELEFAEEELIDAYVRDRLSDEQRRQFQAKLLRSPRLVKRVNFARALAEKADLFSSEAADSIEPEPVVSPPKPKPRRWWAGIFAQQPAFGAALASVVVLFLIGGGILFYGWLRLRSEAERLASERAEVQRQKDEVEKLSTEQRIKIEELNAELRQVHSQQAQDQQRIKELELAQKSKESPQPIFGSVVSLVLNAGSVRGEGSGNKVIIGPNHSSVRFSLPLETNNYGSYDVVIENIDKRAPLPRLRVKPQRTKSGHHLIFKISARNLPAGTYIVKVTGRTPPGSIEEVTESQFTVIRE